MKKLAVLLAAALLASCAWPKYSYLHMLDEGYRINSASANEVAIEMHVSQLKQLGGDTNSSGFRAFVVERLKWHGLCLSGWTPLPCAEDGSCIERTSLSVTVPGRCAP